MYKRQDRIRFNLRFQTESIPLIVSMTIFTMFIFDKICCVKLDVYKRQDRRSVEDTHLAAARRQWEGNGISGTVKMSRREALFYYLLDLILFYDTGGWKQ